MKKEGTMDEKDNEMNASQVSEDTAAGAENTSEEKHVRKTRHEQGKDELKKLEADAKARKKQYKEEEKQRRKEDHEKYPTARSRRIARRIRWKQEKLNRRHELEEHYRDAPWLLRVFRLYLLKPLIALVLVAALGYGAFMALLEPVIKTVTSNTEPVSQEKIYALSPIDEEGAKRIDAAAPVGKDDTWTISVYIIGSNLEDMGEDDLSYLVKAQIEEARAEEAASALAKSKKKMKSFTSALDKNGLEAPAYLYYPEKPVSSDGDPDPSETVVAEMPGFASSDIGEMTSDVWSDNISIVIQTGGATRWSNTMVNPNRTQRFLYHKGEFTEVYDEPLQNATDPKTLSSFLDFCRKEYPADHNMLILWDHGGGAFGYGNDSIFNGMFSLKDIRKALKDVYEPSDKDPAFDIIGFDACLMSSLEVTHALDGFASYYAVSAETEPGDGWNYAPWLKAMSEDPAMSPAGVARSIADSYMDYYMTKNVHAGWMISNDVSFSVIDAKKAGELYKAWCDLTKKQLIDATTDRSVIAEIGRCSNKSTYYVPSYYNVYNTLDLGNYLDLMADTYPDEAGRAGDLLKEAVMYHRENGSLSDSQGMSVYIPGAVIGYGGLMYCLEYVYDICDDPATSALYFYKITGCLDDDMQEYLATVTDNKMPVLDLKPFKKFAREDPEITDTGFTIPVDTTLQGMMQKYEIEAGRYDEEEGTVTNYGRDELALLDGEGSMDCEFDGTWICIEGEPLATEVVSSNIDGVEYRARVLHNGKEAYLAFAYDRDTERFTISGVRSSAVSGLFDDTTINTYNNTRSFIELKEGDSIIPVYDVDYVGDSTGNSDRTKANGKTIRFSKRTEIRSGKLPSGKYLTAAVVSDYRGDVYYSKVVNNDISGGKVRSREADSQFVGRDY